MALSKSFKVYHKINPPNPYSLILGHRNRDVALLFESQACCPVIFRLKLRTAQIPLPQAQNELATVQRLYTKLTDAYGSLGVMQLNSGETSYLFLVVVTGCVSVGKTGGSEIYRITNTSFISLRNQSQDDERVIEVRKLLNSGTFFFSRVAEENDTYGFDLTLCAQKHVKTKETDNRFFWNRMMHFHLERFGIDCSNWLIKAMCGGVEMRTIYVGHLQARACLISRLSCERAGTRFNVRGTNDDGHVANFVETEQLIFLDNKVTSYIQTRGSVPLFWEQPGVQVGSHRVKMSRGTELSAPAFDRHLTVIKQRYGHQVIVNLLGSKEGEAMLSQMFQTHHKASRHSKDVPFIHFDYHAMCRGGKFENLSILHTKINKQLKSFQLFFSEGSSVKPIQSGTIRTNCLDCLDRTNAVQSMIGLDILQKQLCYLGLDQNPTVVSRFVEAFKQMWVQNGDQVSRMYAGTGALEGKSKSGSFRKRTTRPDLVFMTSSLRIGGIDVDGRDEPAEVDGRDEPVDVDERDEPVDVDERDEPVDVDERDEPVDVDERDEPVDVDERDEPLTDASRSVVRTIQNNLLDSSKQEAIDVLLLGSNLSNELADRARILLPTNMLHAPTSILRAMCIRQKEFTQPISTRVSVATWNVNGGKHFRSIAFKHRSMNEWLLDAKKIASENSLVNMNLTDNGDVPVDIFAIGFEEIVDLNAQNIMAASTANQREWGTELQKAISRDHKYVLLTSSQLVGVCLFIFVRPQHAPFVRDVAVDSVKTGLGGATGNKGAVAIRLLFYNTSMCFVCAHFAAGQSQIAERNADYSEITRKITFPMGRTLNGHDYVFWCGDFNYRVDLPNEEVKKLLKNNDIAAVLQADQLIAQQQAGEVFRNFIEGDVNFHPTYKYDLHSNDYDTSEKCRTPAWTDRVLFRRRQTALQVDDPTYNPGKILYYGRAELKTSDHRPVIAELEVEVSRVDNKLRDQVFNSVLESHGPPDGTVFVHIPEFLDPESSIYGKDMTSVYDEVFVESLLHCFANIGEVILVRFDDNGMYLTFREGQMALKAVSLGSSKVEGRQIHVTLKTDDWISVIRNELRLSSNNTIGLCNDCDTSNPTADEYSGLYNTNELEDSFDVPENGEISWKTARCSAQQVAAILDSDDEETLGFDEDYPSDELETDSDDNVNNDNDSESDSDNTVDRLPVRPVIGHNLDSDYYGEEYIDMDAASNQSQSSTSHAAPPSRPPPPRPAQVPSRSMPPGRPPPPTQGAIAPESEVSATTQSLTTSRSNVAAQPEPYDWTKAWDDAEATSSNNACVPSVSASSVNTNQEGVPPPLPPRIDSFDAGLTCNSFDSTDDMPNEAPPPIPVEPEKHQQREAQHEKSSKVSSIPPPPTEEPPTPDSIASSPGETPPPPTEAPPPPPTSSQIGMALPSNPPPIPSRPPGMPPPPIPVRTNVGRAPPPIPKRSSQQ
ncbi:Synaptojanin-1 [Nymphon striatum]|nr:Synaptojanin-1 [Nymphon striatum]